MSSHEGDVIASARATPRRRKRASKRSSLELYHWKQLPDYLRDNEFIFSGYRANTGWRASFKSLFRLHNESGNIWSHLLGFFFFIFLLFCIVRAPPTPLAARHSDVDALWGTISNRLHNTTTSLLHQLHDVHHQLAHAQEYLTNCLPHTQSDRHPLWHPTLPGLKRGLHNLQQSVTEALHAVESRAHSLSATLAAGFGQQVHQLHGAAGRQRSAEPCQPGDSSEGFRGAPGPDCTVAVDEAEGMGREGEDGPETHTAREQLSEGLEHLQDALARNLHSLGDRLTHELTHHLPDVLESWLQEVVHGSVMWPVPRWPLYLFMAGAMTCLFLSATCHLLGCCNRHIASTIWRFDYAGIVANIVSSFYPCVYYAFLCLPLWRWVYLSGITVFGAATLALSLLERFQTPKWRYVRAASFVFLGLVGIVPYMHVVTVYSHLATIWRVLAIDLAMAACYLAGAAFYAGRMPERWAPGRFDLWLHSHQIFHLFVIAGAYCHYVGALELLRWRDASGGCALEVADHAVMATAAAGGEGLLDVDSLLGQLQQRLRGLWQAAGTSMVGRGQGDAARGAVLWDAGSCQEPTCPWLDFAGPV